MEVTEIGEPEVHKDESRVIRINGDVAKRIEARGKFGQTYSEALKDILDNLDALEKK